MDLSDSFWEWAAGQSTDMQQRPDYIPAESAGFGSEGVEMSL